MKKLLLTGIAALFLARQRKRVLTAFQKSFLENTVGRVTMIQYIFVMKITDALTQKAR